MNDHTDAELDRRAHAYEMGANSPEDDAWEGWLHEVKINLVAAGCTDMKTGVDGDEDVDGFSIDFAFEAYEAGTAAADYVYQVLDKRAALNMPFVVKLRTPTDEEKALLDFATSRSQTFQSSADYFAACFEEEAATLNPSNDHLRHLNLAIVDCFNQAYDYHQQQAAEGLV